VTAFAIEGQLSVSEDRDQEFNGGEGAVMGSGSEMAASLAMPIRAVAGGTCTSNPFR